MPKEIRRLMIAADGLIDKPREEVKHLLPRCLRADEVVNAVNLQRFCNVGEYLIPALSFEPIEEDAHIGPAEVEREVVAALLARRQSKIGRQHAEGGIRRACKPEPHILAEVRRCLAQMLCIHRKSSDDFII